MTQTKQPPANPARFSVLTKSRAMEEEMMADFEPGLVAEAKLFLRQVIEKNQRLVAAGRGPRLTDETQRKPSGIGELLRVLSRVDKGLQP